MLSDNLTDWFKEEPKDINQWLVQGLKLGCDQFDMKVGIVSKVTGQDYIVQAVYSNMGDILSPGIKFELSNTYCAAVVEKNKIVTYLQVGAIPNMVLHPVYVALQLESYIGVPLLKNNIAQGTLNFSSYTVRENPFTQDEIALAQKMANKIQAVIYPSK